MVYILDGVVCDVKTSADDSDVMASHEGGDVFTLIHHELNICTNSVNFLLNFYLRSLSEQTSEYRLAELQCIQYLVVNVFCAKYDPHSKKLYVELRRQLICYPKRVLSPVSVSWQILLVFSLSKSWPPFITCSLIVYFNYTLRHYLHTLTLMLVVGRRDGNLCWIFVVVPVLHLNRAGHSADLGCMLAQRAGAPTQQTWVVLKYFFSIFIWTIRLKVDLLKCRNPATCYFLEPTCSGTMVWMRQFINTGALIDPSVGSLATLTDMSCCIILYDLLLLTL